MCVCVCVVFAIVSFLWHAFLSGLKVEAACAMELRVSKVATTAARGCLKEFPELEP